MAASGQTETCQTASGVAAPPSIPDTGALAEDAQGPRGGSGNPAVFHAVVGHGDLHPAPGRALGSRVSLRLDGRRRCACGGQGGTQGQRRTRAVVFGMWLCSKPATHSDAQPAAGPDADWVVIPARLLGSLGFRRVDQGVHWVTVSSVVLGGPEGSSASWGHVGGRWLPQAFFGLEARAAGLQ
jgi:hypothetical protein